MIYKLALIPDPVPKRPKPSQWVIPDKGTIYQARPGGIFATDLIANPTPPTLLQTNRQIRNEGLPIFYGGNRFNLHFPYQRCRDKPDANWVEYISPVSRAPVANLLQAFPTGGTFSMIRHLTVLWTDPHQWCDWSGVVIGFEGLGHWSEVAERDAKRRVGNDQTDWDDEKQVYRAYVKALEKPLDPEFGVLEDFWGNVQPGKSTDESAMAMNAVRALQVFKRRCPQAMGWVETKTFYRGHIQESARWHREKRRVQKSLFKKPRAQLRVGRPASRR